MLKCKYNKGLGKSQEAGFEGGWDVDLEGNLNFNYIIQQLEVKLRDYYIHFISDSGFKSFKVPKRGNKVYQDLFLKKRVKTIQKCLSEVIRVRDRCSNALLLTLTFDSGFGVDEAWVMLKGDDVREAIRRLKEKLEGIGYVKVVEAHLNGKPHLHIILVLEKGIYYRWDEKRGRSYILRQVDYDRISKILDEVWVYGFWDVRPIVSSEAVSYVEKYAFKASEVKSIVDSIDVLDENFDVEDLSEADRKKIILHYFAGKHGLRLFSVSRGLSEKLDSFTNNNSGGVKHWVRCKNPEWFDFYSNIRDKFDDLVSVKGCWHKLRFVGWVKSDKIRGEDRLKVVEDYFGLQKYRFFGLTLIKGFGGRVLIELEIYGLGFEVPEWIRFFTPEGGQNFWDSGQSLDCGCVMGYSNFN